MENQRVTVSNKEGKKKIYPLRSLNVVGGEGGIGGLLVFGGALAVASFMAIATFTSNNNKGKGKGSRDRQPKPKPKQQLLDDECKSGDDNETTQSLTSLLQHSITQDECHRDNTCCWKSNMSINQCNSSELVPTQTLVLEEKIDQYNTEETPTCFLPQEIAFSDYSRPESAASSNENGVVEDCLVSLLKSSSDKALEEDTDELQCGFKSTENENGVVEDCLVSLLKSSSAKSLEEDRDDPQYRLKSTETESEDEDMDEDSDYDGESDNVLGESDDVLGSGEEDTSKATGSTSLDYNEEPVWPAELIPEQEFKGDHYDTHAYSDSNADGSDYAGNDDEAMEVTKEEATLNQTEDLLCDHQPSELRTRVIPMLLLALLLLLVLLTRQPQESFHAMDEIA